MDPIFGVISSRGLACPKSLTNRCETQYFDGKKGKYHSATSHRIYGGSRPLSVPFLIGTSQPSRLG